MSVRRSTAPTPRCPFRKGPLFRPPPTRRFPTIPTLTPATSTPTAALRPASLWAEAKCRRATPTFVRCPWSTWTSVPCPCRARTKWWTQAWNSTPSTCTKTPWSPSVRPPRRGQRPPCSPTLLATIPRGRPRVGTPGMIMTSRSIQPSGSTAPALRPSTSPRWSSTHWPTTWLSSTLFSSLWSEPTASTDVSSSLQVKPPTSMSDHAST